MINVECWSLSQSLSLVLGRNMFHIGLYRIVSSTHRHDELSNRSAIEDCREEINRLEGSLESQYRWCASTRSYSGFKMLSSWLEQCIHQHEICHVKLSHTQPARLLDLNAFPASKDIRLVHTRDTGATAYATLSYCWGNTNRLMLRKENYELFKSQIQLEDLPRTVQEAIEVCRALSMRYLWVDALCIIQEDSEDFTREVANMGAIYTGSLFTVAAADSTDAESGCFRKRFPLRREECVLIESEHTRWIFQNPYQLSHDHDLGKTLLSRRGWVLQEQMMSPRTIHFTKEEIVWECREQTFCAGCRHETKEAEWHSGKKGVANLFRKLEGLEHEMPFQTIWSRLVEQYCGTQLTNLDDRLSALAGIAQFAHEKLQYKSSYGLWLDYFIDELSWRTESPDLRFAEISEQTPSWSWACSRRLFMHKLPFIRDGIPTRILLMHDPPTTRGDNQVLRTARITRSPPITSFQQISSLYKQLSQPVSFGIFGWIRPCQSYPFWNYNLTWKLIPVAEELPAAIEARVQEHWEYYLSKDETKLKTTNIIDQKVSILRYYPDTSADRRQNHVCLLLKRVQVGTRVSDIGLVLEQIVTGKPIFKRVGFFRELVWESDVKLAAAKPGGWDGAVSMPSTNGSIELNNLVQAEREPSVPDSAVSTSPSNGMVEIDDSRDTDSVVARRKRAESDEEKVDIAYLIQHLRLFDGTETEAELEIV